MLGGDPDKRLAIRESKDKGIFVAGVTKITVQAFKDLIKAMSDGNKNRHTGATKMNAESSRSHSIFTLYIETKVEIKGGS